MKEKGTPGKGAQGTPKAKQPTEAERRAAATAKLFKAIRANNLSQVNQAITAGADVNAKDHNPALILAAFNGHKDIVEALLDNGADINAVDYNGWTALWHATEIGHKEIVNLLKAVKAAIAKLFEAVKANDVSKVNEAIEAGANLNAKDSAGWTPLMLAAWNGYRETVQALIDDGADVNALSTAGSTALKLATLKGHGEIVTLLKENKATGNPQAPTENEGGQQPTNCSAGGLGWWVFPGY